MVPPLPIEILQKIFARSLPGETTKATYLERYSSLLAYSLVDNGAL